jgi:hypothetical protein
MERWGEIAKIAPESVWDDAVKITKVCLSEHLRKLTGLPPENVLSFKVENPYTLGGKDVPDPVR